MSFDMQENNRKAYIRSLQQDGKAAKEKRDMEVAEAIFEGREIPLTTWEMQAKREQELKDLEEDLERRVGIDGKRKSDPQPQTVFYKNTSFMDKGILD